MFTRVSIGVGVVLFLAGIFLYGKQALTGSGSTAWVFGLCMTSLLFFNLPTVVARRRGRPEDGGIDQP